MTKNDITRGQVRVPIGPTKSLLPNARARINVVLHGQPLCCRWDPRYGSKQRSGVIGIGKQAGSLLTPGDLLDIALGENGAVLLT